MYAFIAKNVFLCFQVLSFHCPLINVKNYNFTILFQLDFQFLDLHDLNENDKNHLISILKSNITTDALKLPWDTIETNSDVNASITEIPQLQNQWYHNGNCVKEFTYIQIFVKNYIDPKIL